MDATVFDSHGRSHLGRPWKLSALSRNWIADLFQPSFEDTSNPIRCSAGKTGHQSCLPWRASIGFVYGSL
jgi:hypothetical protein